MAVKLYGAVWCNPCKAVKLHLDENNIEYEYFDIDSEENLSTLQELGVRGIPTLVKEDGSFITGAKLTNIKNFIGGNIDT